MNPQQTEPDFNFILNQPGEHQPEHKKSRVVLVGCLITVIVLGVVALLFSSYKSMSSTNKTVDANDPANSFVVIMKEDKPEDNEQIYSLLGGVLVENRLLEKISIQRLKKAIDFSTCKQQVDTDADKAVFSCQTPDGEPRTIALTLSTNNGKSLVVGHRIQTDA